MNGPFLKVCVCGGGIEEGGGGGPGEKITTGLRVNITYY